MNAGIKEPGGNAAMFTFAIIFFGVMMDTGVFDAIVSKMMLSAKRDRRVHTDDYRHHRQDIPTGPAFLHI